MKSAAAPAREVWVDWLKILVVVGILAYHVALVFSITPWVVQNSSPSLVLSGLAAWGYLWGIQLLFLLAGAAAWFSLRSRGAQRFLRERFLRLLIPLVLGMILLSPPQAYLQALNRYHFHGSYLEFLESYVRRVHFYPSPHWLADYGYHLWFLGFLFIVSVAALPLVAWLRRPAGAWAVRLAARAAVGPAALLVPAIPVGIVMALLRPRYRWPPDWPDLFACLVFFVCGFMLMASPQLIAVVRRSGWHSFLIGAVGGIGLGLAAIGGQLGAAPRLTLAFVGLQVLLQLTTWAWVLLLLSLAMNHLNRGPASLADWSEATLPFYVLHHPVVVLLAFFVVQTPAGVYAKFFAILLGAVTLTFLLLRVVVLPFRPLRFLFGMGPPHALRVADGPESGSPSTLAAPATRA